MSLSSETLALARMVERRIAEQYRDEVAARGEAEAALTREYLTDTPYSTDAVALVTVAIERVQRAERARREVATLIRTLEGL